MRGFAIGTFVLVVVYVATRNRAVTAAERGSGAFVQGLRRFLSPDVAGVPQLRGGAS